MKKRLFVLLIAFVLIILSGTTVFAAETTSKMIGSNNSYVGLDRTTMHHQGMIEKCFTMKSGKSVTVTPKLCIATYQAAKDMTKYVSFVIWIYNCKTGARVKNVVVKNEQSLKFTNTLGAKTQYSIQVRPYIEQSAWKKYSTNDINAFCSSVQFKVCY